MIKSDTYQQPIKMNGQIIGWLSVGKINVDTLPFAGYFFDQQLRFTFWATSCAGLFAILLGFLLSRHITQPILLISREAQKLARRDFNINIQVKTRDELHTLALDINSVALKLKHYSQQQQQWLMDISHELRTPLTILYGEVSAILDNVNDVNEGTMQSLQEELAHLNRLVNDLHALSTFDSAEFNMSSEPVELVALIKLHTARYSERLKKAGINLNIEHSENSFFTSGDRDRLGQVVRNILENNLRYTQSPGSIFITLAREDKKIKISIADTGPGVAAELLGNLFDRLYRVESSRNRASGGSGLGLAICKTIIEAHKGTIMAAPSVHGGLDIIISLPAANLA
jgi:two-component system sensor histidine kinase BaeS